MRLGRHPGGDHRRHVDARAEATSGRDGGMHSYWVDKLRPREIIDANGNLKLVVEPNKSAR